MLKRILKWAGLGFGAVLAALLAAALYPITSTIAPIKPRPDTRYWTMADGHRIAYTRVAAPAGAETKAPVIYLHGGPGGYIHSSIVRTLGPLSAVGRDVYFYDQIGSGLSDRLARPKDYSLARHMKDLDAIVASTGSGKAVLIGHSYGGLLAAIYAARHPERVEALILSSPGSLQPSFFDAAGRPVIAAKYPVPASLRFIEPKPTMGATDHWPPRAMAAMAVALLFNRKWVSDAEGDALINTMASRFTAGMVCDPARVQLEEGGGGFFVHGGSNFYGDLEDPRPTMRKMTAPVLVIQGQCDYIPYADAYEYADLFPDSRYRMIEGAGHIIEWEKPDALRAAVADFLAERDPGAPAR